MCFLPRLCLIASSCNSNTLKSSVFSILNVVFYSTFFRARQSCYACKEGNQYKLHFTTVLEGKKYKARPDSFCIEVNRHGMLPGRIVSTGVLESSSIQIPSFKTEVLLNHTICFQTDSVLRIGDELLRIIPSSYILYEGVPVIEDTLHLTVPIDFKFL